MALTQAITGPNTKIAWSSTIFPPADPALAVYTDLFEVTEISGLPMTMSTHDATPHGTLTRFRDFKGGLIDKIEIALKMNYQDDSAATHTESYRQIFAAFTGAENEGVSSPERYFKLTLPNGADFEFAAIIAQCSLTNPLDGLIVYDVTLCVKGPIDYIAPEV